MGRHERRRVTLSVTLEELHALYDAVAEHGRELTTTGAVGEARDLWPFIVRLGNAWDEAAPKRRPRAAPEEDVD
ncbi:hypothetical protein [Microbacterium aureliae]